jgi:hypothetical protein
MSGTSFIQIGATDQIDRLIIHAAALNLPGRVELLRAVQRGDINLVEPCRDAVVPGRVLKNMARPLVVLLGDDDYAATGPAGWATVPRLLRWASSALVHASGGDVPSYRLAIAMALARPRFLLIETDSAHAAEWDATLSRRRIPCIGLAPPFGVHPVPLSRETMQ